MDDTTTLDICAIIAAEKAEADESANCFGFNSVAFGFNSVAL